MFPMFAGSSKDGVGVRQTSGTAEGRGVLPRGHHHHGHARAGARGVPRDHHGRRGSLSPQGQGDGGVRSTETRGENSGDGERTG